MGNSTKVRAKHKDGKTLIKALIRHPMETGVRKDKNSGEVIPAHWIQQMTFTIGGKKVVNAGLNTTVSKNPYISFSTSAGKPGDKIELTWSDNKGGSDSGSTTIK